MNTVLLQAFIAVMQHKSVSKAAEQLHLTQPAISKRLRNLEQEFGVRLFDHIGRQVQPTAAAQRLLPQAERWLADYQEIRRSLTDADQDVAGKLSIGTSHHIGLHHLPELLKGFVQHYPKVQLEIRFVDSEQAHQAVLAGDLELAFLTLPPERHPRLSYQEIWLDDLLFVAAPFHPLAQAESLVLADLLPFPAILPSANTYTSQITLAAFAQQQLKPQATMTTNPLESIRMQVSIGLGWSALPQTLLNDDLSILHLTDVEPLQRRLGMVWHPERTRSRAAAGLAAWIHDATQDEGIAPHNS